MRTATRTRGVNSASPPLEWLRFGLVGQRTRVYNSDRDIQRGGFAQLLFGKATLGFYVFIPTTVPIDSAIVSLAAEF